MKKMLYYCLANCCYLYTYIIFLMKNIKRVKVRKLQDSPYLISEEQKIGETTKGTVYVAYNIQNPGEQLVAKIINFEKNQNLQQTKMQIQRIMKGFHHQHLVKYSSLFILTPTTCCIIMQYCDEGSLSSQLTHFKQMPQEKIWNFLQQFCKGYQKLFDGDFVHFGIKPNNILINNKNYKISDTGFSSKSEIISHANRYNQIKDFLYIPPEIQGHQISSKFDVFSLGCILYQLSYDGIHPFQSLLTKSSKIQEYYQKLKSNKLILKQKNKKGDDRSQQLRQLIKRMLEVQAEKRISWQQIFEHKIIGLNHIHKQTFDRPKNQKQNEINQLQAALIHANRSSILIYQREHAQSQINLEQKFIALQLKLNKNEIRYLEQVMIRLKIMLLSIIHCNNKINSIIRQNAKHKRLQGYIIDSIKKVVNEGLLYLLKNIQIISLKISKYDEQIVKDIKSILQSDREKVIEEYKKVIKIFKNVDEDTFIQSLKTYDLRSFEHCLYNLLTVYCEYQKEGKQTLKVAISILIDIYDGALRLTELNQKEKISWKFGDFQQIQTKMDQICMNPRHTHQFHKYLTSKQLITQKQVTESLKKVGLLFQ